MNLRMHIHVYIYLMYSLVKNEKQKETPKGSHVLPSKPRRNMNSDLPPKGKSINSPKTTGKEKSKESPSILLKLQVRKNQGKSINSPKTTGKEISKESPSILLTPQVRKNQHHLLDMNSL